MSYYIQAEGRRFFAGMIAGSGQKLDTMYVEYGPKASGEPGVRDSEYYGALCASKDSGLIVTRVAHAHVDENCVVHFTGMVRLDDAMKTDGNVALGCVTLAHHDEHGDVLVCTFSLPAGIKLIPGAYTTVRCSIDMGLGK
jgi:hypothetical protein